MSIAYISKVLLVNKLIYQIIGDHCTLYKTNY